VSSTSTASSTNTAGSTSTASASTASSASSAGGTTDGGATALALTSTAFTNGSTIPVVYTCNGGAQGNISPELSWTAGPAGTSSYAIVLTDLDNMLVHWVIWDIPPAVTALPEGLQKAANPAMPAGAKQTMAPSGNTSGYYGPCPPNVHHYEFAVHALDVATLPNVDTTQKGNAVKPVVLAHDLASATLTGTYGP